MKRENSLGFATLVAALVLPAPTASAAAKDSDRLRQKYGELVSQADTQAIVAAILEAGASGDAGDEVDALGRLLAVDAPTGAAVVDALAEWAIAIRLGLTCEGRRVAPWPSADDCPWYRNWAAIDADALLELDYVRQAAAVGWHRSADGLLASAERLAAGAEGLAEHIRSRATLQERKTLERRLAGLAEARAELADYVKTRPGDMGRSQRTLFRHVLQ
jgi:hypothetical protein